MNSGTNTLATKFLKFKRNQMMVYFGYMGVSFYSFLTSNSSNALNIISLVWNEDWGVNVERKCRDDAHKTTTKTSKKGLSACFVLIICVEQLGMM